VLEGQEEMRTRDLRIEYVDGERREQHLVSRGGEPLDVTVRMTRYDLSGRTWTPIFKQGQVAYEFDIATSDPAIGGTFSGTIEGSARVEFFGIPIDDARDVVFVLDQSGSMAERVDSGLAGLLRVGPQSATTKMDLAHRELTQALQGIGEGTRMNVLFFNNGLTAFAPTLVPLEAAARDDLIAFVNTTRPNGSTALAPAMRIALLMNASRVVLLSDGLGNVGGDASDVLRDAREAMLGGVRIDTIGLGPDQDTALLQALATESGGVYQHL